MLGVVQMLGCFPGVQVLCRCSVEGLVLQMSPELYGCFGGVIDARVL